MMEKIKYLYLFYALLLVGLFACSSKDNKTTESQPTADTVAKEEDPWANANLEDETDPYRGLPLDKKLDALMDSIDIQWYAWNKRDDERATNIASLIKEVEKSPKRNKALTDSIKTMHQIAISKKLTPENMNLPNRIDEYDNNMISMVEKINRLMKMPPADKSKYCDELYRYIKYTDELEFSMRKAYDSNAFIFNDLLEKEKANIEKLAGKYKDLKKFPVFAITQ
jgi:hypothetical protein